MAIFWVILNYLSAILPVMVVVGHFFPWWISVIIYGVYFFISGVHPVAGGIIQILLTVVGLFFAFWEFPLWFFIIYLLAAIFAITRFIVLLLP